MAGLSEALLRRIPKAELHLHLRGAMPFGVLVELASRHDGESLRALMPARHLALFQRYDNIRPFLEPGRRTAQHALNLLQYEDLEHFLAAYCFTSYLVTTPDDLRALIDGALDALVSEGIVYAEITISVIEYLWQGLTLGQVMACLREAAAHPGIRVQWIVDLVRDIGPAATLGLLGQIIAQQPENVVAITLGGSEYLYPPEQFSDLYEVARHHGLRRTVHAGEALGPESVWAALCVLGAERVGHGVRAIEDPALVTHLVRRQVPLEVCLTSNVRTGICASYADHPLLRLLAAGVPITVNTDDPTFFHTTLSRELMHVVEMGATPADVGRLIEGGFTHAFLPAGDACAYRREMRRQWRRHVGAERGCPDAADSWQDRVAGPAE